MADLSLMSTLEKSEEGSWMHVYNLVGEELDSELLVLGPDSKEAARIANEAEKEAWKKMAELAGNTKKKGKVVEEEDTSIEDQIKKACRLTKDWKNIEWAGKPFPYNKENAEKLFTQSPAIRDQVLRFYNNRANFTKSGSGN